MSSPVWSCWCFCGIQQIIPFVLFRSVPTLVYRQPFDPEILNMEQKKKKDAILNKRYLF